ncbi:MAG TPA: hypothetical protein VF407_05075 [Polyangiaceae bacterium]
MTDSHARTGWREAIGLALGLGAAPLLAAASLVRHARVLHPRGATFVCRVDAAEKVPSSFRGLANRLEGTALARFSGAMWKADVERFEVLGVALRITRAESPCEVPLTDDQDLLFATIVSPLTMPFSPFTTDAHSFFRNHYWAVAPFEVDGVRAKFRLRATSPSVCSVGRYDELRAAVRTGRASFSLEVRRTLHFGWAPLAEIRVDHEAALDDDALRFSAFRTGRGIVPRGVVQAMRRPAYAASQWPRPR